jgi:hypothetical protein
MLTDAAVNLLLCFCRMSGNISNHGSQQSGHEPTCSVITHSPHASLRGMPPFHAARRSRMSAPNRARVPSRVRNLPARLMTLGTSAGWRAANMIELVPPLLQKWEAG